MTSPSMKVNGLLYLLVLSLAGCGTVQNGQNPQTSSVSSVPPSMEEVSSDATDMVSSFNGQSYSMPQAYEGEVVQIGGEGSHTITKSAWNGDDATNYTDDIVENLVHVDFNTPGDVMWMNCAIGYVLSNCESKTNELIPDRSPGCGILLTDQIRNIVQIACTKSEVSSRGN